MVQCFQSKQALCWWNVFYLTGFGGAVYQLKWEEIPTWMFSPRTTNAADEGRNHKVVPHLVAGAVAAAASLCLLHSGNILLQTNTLLLGLANKSWSSSCAFFLSVIVSNTYMYDLAWISQQILEAKLTLNYPIVQTRKLRHKEDNLSPATQTRTWMIQDLNLASGFRVHIYSMTYAGNGNIGA